MAPEFPNQSRSIRRLLFAIPAATTQATPSWTLPPDITIPARPQVPLANQVGASGQLNAELPRITWREMLFPHSGRSAIFVGLLCALLGLALVVQFRSTNEDQLASLRQEDLVRLLEEVTARELQLEEEADRLLATRQELTTGTNQARAALEVARTRASVEGILSGRLPAQGPGLRIDIGDTERLLSARDFVNLLEELRNAGAEVIQVGDYRIVTSSTFTNRAGQIFLDGNELPDEVTWLVIGDPATMDRALEIPGGALPRIRQAGATTLVTQSEFPIEITATANLRPPVYAQPVISD